MMMAVRLEMETFILEPDKTSFWNLDSFLVSLVEVE